MKQEPIIIIMRTECCLHVGLVQVLGMLIGHPQSCNYLVCICAAGLCIWLHEFKCFQCGLLCPACCTDRVIHAFTNTIREVPLGSEIFYSEL